MKDERADSSFILHPSSLCLMPSASRDIVVQNKDGLHARPAMQFVDLANQFASEITVEKGATDVDEAVSVDGKSVMQMITLEATQGTNKRVRGGVRDSRWALLNTSSFLTQSRSLPVASTLKRETVEQGVVILEEVREALVARLEAIRALNAPVKKNKATRFASLNLALAAA